MTFGEKLRLLREKKHLTQNEFAKIIAVERSTISKWEHGSSNPGINDAILICDYFDVSLDELFFDDKLKTKEPISQYDIKHIPLGRSIKIPLIKQIKPNVPLYSENNIERYIETPYELVKDGEYFYYLVCDDSMSNSRIQKNDTVLIKQQKFIENNDVVLVLYNNHNALLRRVKKQDDQIILYPDNYNFEIIIVPNTENVFFIGKVVQVMFEMH